jgi:hypothetical protein
VHYMVHYMLRRQHQSDSQRNGSRGASWHICVSALHTTATAHQCKACRQQRTAVRTHARARACVRRADVRHV